MLTFELTSLQYFANISIEIQNTNNTKVDIFKLHMERPVENVQDGISRPLGRREIQKNKSVYSFTGHAVFTTLPRLPT